MEQGPQHYILWTSTTISAFFPSRRPLSAHSDLLSDLRFSLEIMPGSRKYVFTPTARAEITNKLYVSFMGQYPHFFYLQGLHKCHLSYYWVNTRSKSDLKEQGRRIHSLLEGLVVTSSKKAKVVIDASAFPFKKSKKLIRKWLMGSEGIVHWTTAACCVLGVSMRQPWRQLLHRSAVWRLLRLRRRRSVEEMYSMFSSSASWTWWSSGHYTSCDT